MHSSNRKPSGQARLCLYDFRLFLFCHRFKISWSQRFLDVFLMLRYFRDALQGLFWPQVELMSEVPRDQEILPV